MPCRSMINSDPVSYWKFLRGHYANPKEEQRIFLADLMSSTSMAEKLGNEQYRQHPTRKIFLPTLPTPFFNKGEIYQYVGDEIVISWKLKIGLEDNRLRCYFKCRAVKKNGSNTCAVMDWYLNSKPGYIPVVLLPVK